LSQNRYCSGSIEAASLQRGRADGARGLLIHDGCRSCATVGPLPVHEIESAERLFSGSGQAVLFAAFEENRPSPQIPSAGVGNHMGQPALLGGCRSGVSSIDYALKVAISLREMKSKNWK
jgi:hypothetical protein